MFYAQDETALERKNQQEAILQSIRDSQACPLMMNLAGRITPIAPELVQPKNTAATVTPFRKRESPMPTPPYRPAPAQPLRPAATANLEKLELVKKSLSTLTRAHSFFNSTINYPNSLTNEVTHERHSTET